MSARVIYTYDDYAALPDDGRRYELYEGELIEMTPAPRPRHQLVLGSLYVLLREHVRNKRLGEVLLAPIDLILSPITVLQPDLVYIESARRSILTDRAVEGPPTLVVEILSPSTGARDRGIKQRLYGKYAVPFSWIVDAERRTIQGYRLEGDSYTLVATLDEAAPRALPPLPDLSLDPAAIWS